MPFDADALAFGDIALVPFPFTDQTSVKRRPAVVISALGYNARHPDIILMPVTSQLRSESRPDDVMVENWREAGLLRPSAVKPVIATLEQPLILRRLGALAERDRAALAEMLKAILEST